MKRRQSALNVVAVRSLSPISPSRVESTKEALDAQIEQLTRQLSELKKKVDSTQRRQQTRKEQRSIVCWRCRRTGNLKRNCPVSQRNVFESAAVGSKLVVKGRLGDRDTQMLVDTGSAVTLVKEAVWKETCPGNSQPVFHFVVAANGDKLEVTKVKSRSA